MGPLLYSQWHEGHIAMKWAGTGELTLDFEENSGINAHLVGNREHKIVLFILG